MLRPRWRSVLGSCWLCLASLGAADPIFAGRSFYVRQTLGDDHNDGLSAAHAWKSVSKLSRALAAGDSAYVGPGLYREQVILENGGTEAAPIRIIADTSGRQTGDPPGVVLIAGADPVDESIFVAHSAPGVFEAHLPERVVGAVEMDGAQYRYQGVLEPVRDVPYLDQVAERPARFYYDMAEQVLYLHTSDGRHPSHHELELIHRTAGIGMTGKPFVVVEGFTFRHQFDAGIEFWEGSSHGVALNNTAFDNLEVGIAIENVSGAVLLRNRLVGNHESQLLAIQSAYHAESNCFENGGEGRWTADLYYADRFPSLGLYQHAKGQDLASRSGSCGSAPGKVDVRDLHARSLSYVEAARRRLGSGS